MNPRDLLTRARAEGTPLIDADTNAATFVWEGDTAPLLFGDFNTWGFNPDGAVRLQEVEAGVWAVTLPFPPDTYMEYIYADDPQDKTTRQPDPFNRRRVNNGVGGFNHWFTMPAARRTPLIRVGRGVQRGLVTHHTLESGLLFHKGKRDLWLYQPAVDSDEPVPLLVVWDGRDYLRRGKLAAIVDNLIAQGRIRPLALALLDNAGSARYVEYNTGETALEQVAQLVLPLARERINLIDVKQHPGAYGLLGGSMGGLMALYGGLRLPHIFSRVIAQAGAFVVGQSLGQPLTQALIERAPAAPLNIWMDVGTFDWLLESNRAMCEQLRAQGYAVTYREYSAGHNYSAWRDALPDALQTVFGV